jgi:hypothetical protein
MDEGKQGGFGWHTITFPHSERKVRDNSQMAQVTSDYVAFSTFESLKKAHLLLTGPTQKRSSTS